MAQEAPIVFRLQAPGQESVRLALSRFSDKVSDFQPYWQDYFRPAWLRSVTMHYESQGATSGEPWPPLSEAYGAWKQRHWPGMPIGVLSGATRESLTFPDDANAIWEARPESLTVGTRVPWAYVQQMGAPSRNMPKRPPLRISDEFAMTAMRQLQAFGAAAAKDAGLGEAVT